MTARPLIENQLARYGWTFDMDEIDGEDGIGGVFTEDAEVMFGTGMQYGRPAVVAELERRRQKYRPDAIVPWHVITNVYVRKETADRAEVVSFFTMFERVAGEKPVVKSIGYYDDVFVDDGGVWRVKQRSVVNVP